MTTTPTAEAITTNWDSDHIIRAAMIQADVPAPIANSALAFTDPEEAWATLCAGDRRLAEFHAAHDHLALAVVAEKRQARLVIPGDQEWPDQLDELGREAPLGLWVVGNVNLADASRNSIAITGGRAAANASMATAQDIACDLAGRAKFVNPISGSATALGIVSGLSYGVEASALTGALKAEGTPIAVTPGGIDQIYPHGLQSSRDEIITAGLLVSAKPFGRRPTRDDFSQRSAIVAGLALGLVVIEARLRSSAMRAADTAAALGRPVLVMPGPISTTTQGGHELVQDGTAQLVTTSLDIFTAIADELA